MKKTTTILSLSLLLSFLNGAEKLDYVILESGNHPVKEIVLKEETLYFQYLNDDWYYDRDDDGWYRTSTEYKTFGDGINGYKMDYIYNNPNGKRTERITPSNYSEGYVNLFRGTHVVLNAGDAAYVVAYEANHGRKMLLYSYDSQNNRRSTPHHYDTTSGNTYVGPADLYLADQNQTFGSITLAISRSAITGSKSWTASSEDGLSYSSPKGFEDDGDPIKHTKQDHYNLPLIENGVPQGEWKGSTTSEDQSSNEQKNEDQLRLEQLEQENLLANQKVTELEQDKELLAKDMELQKVTLIAEKDLALEKVASLEREKEMLQNEKALQISSLEAEKQLVQEKVSQLEQNNQAQELRIEELQKDLDDMKLALAESSSGNSSPFPDPNSIQYDSVLGWCWFTDTPWFYSYPNGSWYYMHSGPDGIYVWNANLPNNGWMKLHG